MKPKFHRFHVTSALIVIASIAPSTNVDKRSNNGMPCISLIMQFIYARDDTMNIVVTR